MASGQIYRWTKGCARQVSVRRSNESDKYARDSPCLGGQEPRVPTMGTRSQEILIVRNGPCLFVDIEVAWTTDLHAHKYSGHTAYKQCRQYRLSVLTVYERPCTVSRISLPSFYRKLATKLGPHSSKMSKFRSILSPHPFFSLENQMCQNALEHALEETGLGNIRSSIEKSYQIYPNFESSTRDRAQLPIYWLEY